MSKTDSQNQVTRDSIKSIHKEFNGGQFGWNGITWLVELEDPVEINVQTETVMVDYFVASSIVDEAIDTQRTIVFPVNDMYRPLKHQGVVGANGWTLKKSMIAFRAWLDQRPSVRAIQEVTL